MRIIDESYRRYEVLVRRNWSPSRASNTITCEQATILPELTKTFIQKYLLRRSYDKTGRSADELDTA